MTVHQPIAPDARKLRVVILIEELWITRKAAASVAGRLDSSLMQTVITSLTRQLEQQLNTIKNALQIQIVPRDHLFRLPHEIIIRIVAELDIAGVSRCLQVCTRLRDIINSTRLHGYKARLALANLEDGIVDSSYDIEARLAQLEAHQDAWKSFRWKNSTTIPTDDREHRKKLSFHGGVFSQPLSFPNGISHVFTQLPSSTRGIEMKQWSLDCIEDDTFTYSPAQDLLVCLDSGHNIERSKPPILIRLLSLTDGKSHPLASFPSIRVANLPAPLDHWKFTIQICGHTLSILADPKEKDTSDLDSQLFLVNWKTGRLLKLNTTGIMTGVKLITERYLLICNLYYPANPSVPGLSIVDLEAKPTRCTSISLLLPKPQGHEAMILRVEDGDSGCLQRESLQHSALPFQTSSDDNLIMVLMVVVPQKTEESERMEKKEKTEEMEDSECFALFIPRSVLLLHANKMASLPRPLDQRVSVTIPWGSWGPSSTKCLEWTDDGAVCGMRVLARKSDANLFSADYLKAKRQYRIFDFNPFPIRYGFQKDPAIQLSHTTTVHSALFPSPIVTSLPCRIIDGELSEETELYLWNEDTLVIGVGNETKICSF